MLGLETQIEVGLQSDFTTFNTTTRRALNVYKVTGGQTKSRPEDPILNGGMANLTDPTEPGPGLSDHKITLEVPVCVNQLAFHLRAFFGAPVTDGADPDYEHVFKSGVSTLPFVSIQEKLQTGDYRRHVGCVGEEFKIGFDPSADGFARATFTYVGLEEQRATVAAAGTVTAAPALDRPAESLSSVLWNNVAGGQIIGGEITFKRKLKRIRSADGTGVPNRVEYDGKSTLGGSIKLRYGGQSIISDAWSRTEREIQLEILRSSARGFNLLCGHAVLDEVPVGRDGPDGVEIDIPLMAYQDPTDAALIITALSQFAQFATFPTT